MDVVAPILTAIVGIIGGYIVGKGRLRYEHLHERRARVIAELSKLLASVERGVVDFTDPFFQRGEVDRRQQAEEAKRAFFELVECYRANEVWLDVRTCINVESFLANVRFLVSQYFDELDDQGYARSVKAQGLSVQITQETESLRRELLKEFREIMYPPWWQFWR